MLPPVKGVRPAWEKARDDSGVVLEELEDLEDLELEELEELELEDLEEASQDQRELASVKESMLELENQLESVSESVEDFVEHFGETEQAWLVKENARLTAELNELRNSPELLLRKLPQELWLNILGYLKPGELCQAGLACHGLLQLSRDPSLWPSLTLLGDALADTQTVLVLVARCSHLARVSVTARDDAAQIVTALAEHCPLLTSLTVKYCPPLPHSCLSSLSSSCPLLSTLDLESTGCLNRDCGALHPEDSTCTCSPTVSFPLLLSGLRRLTSLNLFACRSLLSEGLRCLADTCTHLTSLNIDEVNYLSDESVTYLVAQRGAALRHLWIDGESLTDRSFSTFHKLQQLELLSVSFCDSMGAEGLRAISRLPRLEWLRLRRGAELEPADFVSSFSQGQLGGRLTYLDLSECSKLDDSGLEAVARSCNNLGTVSLNWCWDVTDIGLGHLVHRCPALVSLNLCGVVRLQGDCLFGLEKCLPGLKLLDLEQCPDVELAQLQDLVRRNLSLVVRDYYGERVAPCMELQDYLMDHPEITFITYDHELEEPEGVEGGLLP